MRSMIVMLAAAGLATMAAAQSTPPSSTVSGVTVAPPRGCLRARHPADPEVAAPRVVSTFPANGDVVRPGILILRITFDLPMICDGLLSDRPPGTNPCPGSVHDALLTADRRTFFMACVVRRKARYGLSLNDGFEHRFTSLAGRPAPPYALTFETSDGPELTSVAQAFAQDKTGPQAIATVDAASSEAEPTDK